MCSPKRDALLKPGSFGADFSRQELLKFSLSDSKAFHSVAAIAKEPSGVLAKAMSNRSISRSGKSPRARANPWLARREELRHSAEEKFHHHVYVVLLNDKAALDRRVLRANPNRDAAKPCLYVGMTGLKPSERFLNHQSGYKAARWVRKYGVRLLPELYEYLNPMPFEAACQMEKELALELRAQGYAVVGGT